MTEAPPPLRFSDPLTRKVWLSEKPLCVACGHVENRVKVPSGTFIQLECSRSLRGPVGRRADCGAFWWCISLHPGTIGGTFAALFDYHVGRIFLHRLFIQTHALSDEDLWGFEVVPRDGQSKLLQIEVSRLEATQRPTSSVTQRILKALSAAL